MHIMSGQCKVMKEIEEQKALRELADFQEKENLMMEERKMENI